MALPISLCLECSCLYAMPTMSHLTQLLPTLKANLYRVSISTFLHPLRANFTWSIHHTLSHILDICNCILSSATGRICVSFIFPQQWLTSALYILGTPKRTLIELSWRQKYNIVLTLEKLREKNTWKNMINRVTGFLPWRYFTTRQIMQIYAMGYHCLFRAWRWEYRILSTPIPPA